MFLYNEQVLSKGPIKKDLPPYQGHEDQAAQLNR